VYYSAYGVIKGYGRMDGAAGIANTIGYSAGIINSYVWNRVWTFNVDIARPTFKRFIWLNLFCLSISTICMYCFVDILGYSYKYTWLVVMGSVTIINYLGCKYIAFK
jgi:putative flippase GtrA